MVSFLSGEESIPTIPLKTTMDSSSSYFTPKTQENSISIRCQLQTKSIDSQHHSTIAKWNYTCHMHGTETCEDPLHPIKLGLFHPFHGLEVQRHETQSDKVSESVDSSSIRSRLMFLPFVTPCQVNQDYSHQNIIINTHHHDNTQIPPMRLLTRSQSPFPPQRVRSSEVSRTIFSCTKEKRDNDNDMDSTTSDSISLSNSNHSSGMKVVQDVITIFLHQITQVQCIDTLNINIHTETDKYIITTESVNGRDLLIVFLKRFLPNGSTFVEKTLEDKQEICYNTIRNQVSRTESLDMQKFQDYAMNQSMENDTHMDKLWRWSKQFICDMTNICSCGEERGTKDNPVMKEQDDNQTEISEELELDIDGYDHL